MENAEEKSIREILEKMIFRQKAQDAFPTYTNGDRKLDPEQDEKSRKVFSKIVKP